MRRSWCRMAALATGFALILAAPAFAATRPVVVELFTSQGCSSCPPADALLRELARRPDIIALGYHIDYWNGLGWKDPLSTPEATARQRAYARRFDNGQIYTPQMIVDGTREMVGSDRAAVLAAIGDGTRPAAAPVQFAADHGRVTIGAGSGNGTVRLVRFVRHRTTRVGAGENAHRTAEDADGVESITRLGEWHGAARDFTIAPPAAGHGVAVLVQAPDGRMLGAGAVETPATDATLQRPIPRA
ncbi:MAG: DUF1223 domain-containing protein [Stellaceae bacterium]